MSARRPAAKKAPAPSQPKAATPVAAEPPHDATGELAQVLREIHGAQPVSSPVASTPIVGPGVITPPAAASSALAAADPLPKYAVNEDDKKELGDFVGFALSKTCNVIARRAGDHWKLEDDEAIELGEAWAHLLLWYFPGFRLHPIWVAIGASAAVFGPRFAMQMEINAEAAKLKAAAARGDQGKPAEPPAGGAK